MRICSSHLFEDVHSNPGEKKGFLSTGDYSHDEWKRSTTPITSL